MHIDETWRLRGNMQTNWHNQRDTGRNTQAVRDSGRDRATETHSDTKRKQWRRQAHRETDKQIDRRSESQRTEHSGKVTRFAIWLETDRGKITSAPLPCPPIRQEKYTSPSNLTPPTPSPPSLLHPHPLPSTKTRRWDDDIYPVLSPTAYPPPAGASRPSGRLGRRGSPGRGNGEEAGCAGRS